MFELMSVRETFREMEGREMHTEGGLWEILSVSEVLLLPSSMIV